MKKLLKTILTTTALAMALGAGVAVGAHQEAKVEKADAKTSTTIYYAITTTYTVKCNVHFGSNQSDPWGTYVMSKNGAKFGGKDVYTCTFTDEWDGLATMQLQKYDGNTHMGEETPISSWTGVSTYNGKIWDGSWKTYTPDPEQVTVTRYAVLDGATPTKIDDVVINKGSTYAVPASIARAGYTFGGWYTNTGCTTSYTSRTVNDNLNLYAKYTTTVYTVSVAGGSPISLSKNGASQTEYTCNITAEAGDMLTFTKDGNSYSVSPENATNNNYGAGGIRFTGTFAIYLKTDVNQVWVAGMPTTAGSYYLMVNGVNHGEMTANPNNPSEKQITGAYFNANDKINILSITSGPTYTYKNPSLNNYSVSGFSPSGSDINCDTAGYYDLYYNFGEPNSLYFGESASTACVSFANAFLTALSGKDGICDSQGATNLAALKAEWVNQYDAWVALGAANQYAQGIMTNKDKTASDKLAECVSLYDYIISKYGSQLNGTSPSHGAFSANFMGRTVTPLAGSNMLSLMNEEKTTTATLAVVIVTVVSLTAVGGFFLLKKKKEIK